MNPQQPMSRKESDAAISRHVAQLGLEPRYLKPDGRPVWWLDDVDWPHLIASERATLFMRGIYIPKLVKKAIAHWEHLKNPALPCPKWTRTQAWIPVRLERIFDGKLAQPPVGVICGNRRSISSEENFSFQPYRP